MTLTRYTPLKAAKGLPRGVSTLARTELRRTPKDGSPGRARTRKSNSPAIPKALREAVLKRDRYCCIRCGRNITSYPYSLQHLDPRGMGGSRHANTMANLVVLCGTATSPGDCHQHVESYRTEATSEGYLVPMWAKPEEWPVKVLRRFWRQPGKTWTPAQPHPEQMRREAA